MDSFKDHLLKEISGTEFNKLCNNMKLVKLTNETENHNNFQFRNGLNIDIIPFDPTKQCNKGGIYFIDAINIKNWLSYNETIGVMVHVRVVIIPDDARVYIEPGKFKADKIILGPKMIIKKYLENPDYLNDPEELCFVKYKQCTYGGETACYIEETLINEEILTKEICMIAVKRWYKALKYVPEHLKDKDICTEAFTQDIYALRYVPTELKTKEMCMSAFGKD